MRIEDIAAVCHEANRRYCLSLGDVSQKSWEEASFSQKQSAIKGAIFVSVNPDSPPRRAHENWARQKEEEGWVYGKEKDENTKTHPCLVPYDALPKEQRIKDILFRNIVLALTQGEPNV